MTAHKNIRLLTWFNFFTDFRLYSAVAIIYFQQITGSFALGMSLFSITMVTSALLEIPTGIFSDRIGRRKTVICGAAAAMCMPLFYALASLPQIVDIAPFAAYLMLIIGAMFEGLSRAFYSGNNDALLHDTLAETNSQEEYSEHLGKVSSMFQLALGISAVIRSFLASWSMPLIMWLSIIPQMICFILAFKIVEPKVHLDKHAGNIYDHLKEAAREFKHNRSLRLLTLSSAWRYAFGEASYQFSSAFFNLVWPVWALGLARGATNIFATASFHYAGRIIKKFGAVPVMIFGSVYNRVVSVIAGFFPNGFTMALLTTSSLFYGTGNVAEGTLMQKEFKPHVRASMASLSAFVGSLLFAVVAFGVGFMADMFSTQQAYLMMQIFLAVNIVWQMRLVR